MPEEESEDETNADAHNPSSQHKHQQTNVCQSLKIVI